jgi:glucan 1,3-beta-glucosidase
VVVVVAAVLVRFDNSGMTMGFEWTSKMSTEPVAITTFSHWSLRDAGWMGKFNKKGYYEWIDHANIQRSLRVIEKIVEEHQDDPAIMGIEPVNEPWQYTPIEELKRYYWEGFLIMKRIRPDWKWVMHDSFRFNVETWGGFMAGCPGICLDTHIYQARV